MTNCYETKHQTALFYVILDILDWLGYYSLLHCLPVDTRF
jgi:hypothetical protein